MAAAKTFQISFSIDDKPYAVVYDPKSKADYQGGNGRILFTDDHLYAVKILKRINDLERYKRFAREVEAVKNIGRAVPGAVIPIMFSYIPDFDDQKSENDISYYVMPNCQAGSRMPKEWKYEEYIKFLLDVSESLLKIHECGYAHRDVKRTNVLKYKGKWLLSDLGCSYVNGVERITGENETVGPKGCPEELERIDVSDRKPDALRLYQSSDAFLFAKMIWQSLVGGETFDGSFVHGDNNYRRYIGRANILFGNLLFLPLVEIMEHTILYEARNWDKRMTMREIHDTLERLHGFSEQIEECNGLLLKQKLLVFSAMETPSYRSYQEPLRFHEFFSNLPKGTRIELSSAYVQEGFVIFDSNSFSEVDGVAGTFRIVFMMGRSSIIFKLEEIKIYDDGSGAELLTGPLDGTLRLLMAEKYEQSTIIDTRTVLGIKITK